jgi:cellulose synthase/poly-beta-1,6-N-acetylglucosamine synthase-like glycosyltransferase
MTLLGESHPSVSVIIPSRNEPFSVAKMTFDSALKQHYPDKRLAVIVVDNSDLTHPDFAPWRSYVVASNGARGDLETRFIHRDGTEGFKAGNMDLGLQAAKGDLVLFLDVDSTIPPDCLEKTVVEFDRDPALAVVQFYLVGTNRNTSPLARTGVWALGITRYKECMRGAHGGWALFVGHNALWRRHVLTELGSCIDQYKGKDIVVEDASLTIRASLNGYYGKNVWHSTGEWVPGSLKDLESMWARWTYGTCQVILKYWRIHFGAASDHLTLSERTDILHHGCNYPAVGLLPIWIILPFVSHEAAGVLGLFMNLLVLAPLVGHCLSYFVNRKLRAQFGQRTGHLDFLIAMFVVEPFITWAKFKAIWRFVWRRPQGWKPTGKSGTETGGWLDVLWKWKDMLIFSSSILIWFGVDALRGTESQVLLTRVPALLLSMGMLLSVVLYGKAQIVHPDDLEASTSIDAVLAPGVPSGSAVEDSRKIG